MKKHILLLCLMILSLAANAQHGKKCSRKIPCHGNIWNVGYIPEKNYGGARLSKSFNYSCKKRLPHIYQWSPGWGEN